MCAECNGGDSTAPFLSMTTPFLYFEVDPPPELTGIVLAFWGFEVRDGAIDTHTLWPDASVSITWGMLGQRTIVLGAMGARTVPVTVPVQPGISFRGVRFWPDVVRPLCGLDPRHARNRRLELEELGAFGERVRIAVSQAQSLASAFPIFEEAIGACLTSREPRDPLARRALLEIDAAPETTMRDLARDLGVSDRQLRRRFGAATGLSPKEYARVRRFRQTLGRVLAEGEATWSTIAARSGFADQPHLVNEIVRMTAYTPTVLERRLRLIEHVGVKP